MFPLARLPIPCTIECLFIFSPARLASQGDFIFSPQTVDLSKHLTRTFIAEGHDFDTLQTPSKILAFVVCARCQGVLVAQKWCTEEASWRSPIQQNRWRNDTTRLFRFLLLREWGSTSVSAPDHNCVDEAHKQQHSQRQPIVAWSHQLHSCNNHEKVRLFFIHRESLVGQWFASLFDQRTRRCQKVTECLPSFVFTR